MNLRRTFKVSWEGLTLNKVRSFLTTLGVIIGVAAVIVMLAVSAGPEATPPVVFTTLFLGRNFEKEKPVPPPVLWMRAQAFKVSKIPSIESSIGSTKQAES